MWILVGLIQCVSGWSLAPAAARHIIIVLSAAGGIGGLLDPYCNNQNVDPSNKSDVDPEKLDPVYIR